MKEKEFFAYCRESIDLKTGIEIQKEKIERYCKAYNIKIVKWFIDNDASAYKLRPKYEAMMKELKDSPVSGLICTHLFRFGRSTQEVLMEHDKVLSFGKELVFVEHNIDSSNVVGKANLGMLAVFADFERNTTNERLLNGRIWAKNHTTKSGLPMNRPPISIDWNEYDEWAKKGLSTSAICKIITDTRTHKKISKSALYKAVKHRGK